MSSRLRTRLRAGTGLSTPSLSLEFQTATGALDPRITFSRTSQATLVDSTGKLTYAPNNLLTNSETFEASAWTKENSTVTANTTVSPDGASNADSVIENTATAFHRVYQAATIANGIACTASVFVKAIGSRRLYINMNTIAGAGALFDLTGAGAVVNVAGAAANKTATITSAGSGWYRCAVTGTGTGTAGNVLFQTNLSTSTTATDESYAGDGTSGLILWGAQLEQVTYQTTPGTYNSTSPKNLLGYTQEFDNAAWTKSNAFVQTNLLLQSQAFDNASWTKTNGGAASAPTVTANHAAAPDGTTTADRVQFTLNGGTASADISQIRQTVSQDTVSTYTLSFWARSTDGVSSYNMIVFGAPAAAQAITVTGSWTRFIITGSGANLNLAVALRGGQTPVNSNTADVLMWGAQFVQGSTAGDYQRTDAAAAAVQYVAPDGSRTADKLVETTAASTVHQVSQIYSGAVASGVYTFNVYLAKNERDKAVVIVSDNATGDCRVVVDLTAGTVGSPTITGNWTTASATIQAASGGFFRVSITCTKSASGNANVVPIIGLYTTSASYTGDGTSGIYIWGAQLSNSASLDPYVYNPVAAPTSAAYYGPRFDYDPVTLANKGLLIEEQRTNLLTYSQQFDDASWVKYAGTSITPNATISPDGSSTADLMYPATSGTNRGVYQSFTGGNLTYAQSIYVKSAGKNFVAFYDFEGSTYAGSVDLTTGSTASVKAGYTITPTQAGSGWWRITVTATTTTGTRYLTLIVVDAAGSASVTANGTSGVYIWGAQVEAGSFATSYIPTVASQVTRTAETPVMQGANFSNWYNQNAGTFAVEADSLTTVSASYLLTASDGTSNNRVGFYRSQAVIGGYIITGGVTLMEYTVGNVTVNVPFDTALAATANDGNFSFNGSISATDTSLSMPVATKLDIGHINSSGSFNGHIRRIGYYPTRLANEQLQSLTAQSTIPSLSLDFTTQVFNVG